MTSTTLPVLRPFFKGNTLESEFGFVHCYHYHPINLLLHIIAMPILIFSLLTITFTIDYRLCLLFYVLYCTAIFTIDIKTSLAYFCLFGLLLIPAITFSTHGTSPILYGVLIFLTSLICQGLGHYIFEKAAPAFRLFEAMITTPTFLMMYVISNRNQTFWNDVKNETDKWRQMLKNKNK